MKDTDTRGIVEAIADRLRDELICPLAATDAMLRALNSLVQAEARQKRPNAGLQRAANPCREDLSDGA